MAPFPQLRMRRFRQASWSRRLVQEHDLLPSDLILPVFVHEGEESQAIASMPGLVRHSMASLLDTARSAREWGIQAMALFPVVPSTRKCDQAKEAINPNNLMCRAIQALKDAVPEMGLIADVALDPYTSHGHDGLMEGEVILNDATVAVLVEQACVLAQAGADVVAPSDMQDGRVGAIREALENLGLHDTIILAYSAKYASHFYGPFRDAVGSASSLKGDKLTYQQHPANSREALREARMDCEEGADAIMIKPGMPYLDVVWRVREALGMPTFVYQVSGEYTMLQLLAQHHGMPAFHLFYESLIGFKRAGADAILTYAALEIAQGLHDQ